MMDCGVNILWWWQDEDMLLVKMPKGLRGQVMLEAMRVNCQRVGYLDTFEAQGTGAENMLLALCAGLFDVMHERHRVMARCFGRP